MDQHALKLALVLLLAPVLAWAKPLCRNERRLPSMGTVFEIQTISACEQKSDEGMYLEIQKTLNRIETDLSLYQKNSAINQLNNKGQLDKAPRSLINVLKLSLTAGNQTQSAFDITIWPVLELIKKSFAETSMPPQHQALARLRPLVNYRNVIIRGANINLRLKGMKITLDGIAKGYAVDQVANILEKHAFKNYLINFSGNMRWRGQREDMQKWKIRIWNPLDKTTVKIPVGITGAIASSGGQINHYSKDSSWHHIIDPKALAPAHQWLATSVYGPKATTCDFLSTAVFALNSKQIQKVVNQNFKAYSVWATGYNKRNFRVQAPLKN